MKIMIITVILVIIIYHSINQTQPFNLPLYSSVDTFHDFLRISLIPDISAGYLCIAWQTLL